MTAAGRALIMDITVYIFGFVSAVFMTVAAVFFKNRYLSEEKQTEEKLSEEKQTEEKRPAEKRKLTDLLKSEKKALAIFGAVYIAAAAANVLLVMNGKFTPLKSIQYLLLWEAVCAISFIDFKVKKIPNRLLIIAFAVRLIGIPAELLLTELTIYETVYFSLIGAAAGGLIIQICMFFSKGGVGAGDVKLYALVGAYFGFAGLINVMFYSLFIAAIVGIVLLVTKKAQKKTQLAMAPFVFLGINIYLVLS